uniref:OTU domain-containing protein n=1 Tax=Octopus bimaculoides TaxID=37653 RepID=A0A0L8FT09_OCTBM
MKSLTEFIEKYSTILIHTFNKVMGDGNCMFRALSLYLKNNRNYRTLPEESVRYICNNWKYFHSFIPNSAMQEYQAYMNRDGTYDGNVELAAISGLYDIAIQAHHKSDDEILLLFIICGRTFTERKISVLYSGKIDNGHCDGLFPLNNHEYERNKISQVSIKRQKNENSNI